ncbi:hypothetical protein COU80_02950 [Candidatus Peregrinibacteria bacterium CG10_big_fil_rev_8_21_14_0_10_55_24]|nr:MAG: hypothetical protein COU80_02950 [Candidatus Peregrinibacteria bacterium CG10_big_fil_rev_8_21_14_0_10_55_24]
MEQQPKPWSKALEHQLRKDDDIAKYIEANHIRSIEVTSKVHEGLPLFRVEAIGEDGRTFTLLRRSELLSTAEAVESVRKSIRAPLESTPDKRKNADFYLVPFRIQDAIPPELIYINQNGSTELRDVSGEIDQMHMEKPKRPCGKIFPRDLFDETEYKLAGSITQEIWRPIDEEWLVDAREEFLENVDLLHSRIINAAYERKAKVIGYDIQEDNRDELFGGRVLRVTVYFAQEPSNALESKDTNS